MDNNSPKEYIPEADPDDNAALDEAMRLLEERFSTVVILTETRVEDGGHLSYSRYRGSLSAAVGLCYRWGAHTCHESRTW